MLTLLLLSSLAAQPQPVNVAVLGFTQVKLSNELAASYSETFALRLAQAGVGVTTQKDVIAILGIERQRTLLGCNGQSSCIAELAGALGVDGIVLGDIALVGKTYQLTIKILSPADARPLFLHLARLSTEDEVLVELDRAAKLANETLKTRLRGAASVTVSPPERSRPLYRLLPAFGGVLAGIVGGALLLLAKLDYDRLNDPTYWPVGDARGLVNGGRTSQIAGLVLVSVGFVAIVGGVLWYALGPLSNDSVAGVSFDARTLAWSF